MSITSNPEEDRRRQQSVSAHVKQTFRKINFNRVFHCKPYGKVWLGKDLYKTNDGKYVCLHCNHEVEDVTATPLGKSFLDYRPARVESPIEPSYFSYSHMKGPQS